MTNYRNDLFRTPGNETRALDLKDFVVVTKALSDSNRIRALIALRRGELCVCQIIALLGLAPSTVSKHICDSQAGRAGQKPQRGTLDAL